MALYSQETIEQARAFDNAAAPEKMRVHALAKALGIQSKDVIRELESAGIENKRAQSAVSADDRAKVITAVTAGAEQERAEAKKPAQKKTAKKAAKKAPAKAAKKSAKKTSKRAPKKQSAEAAAAPDAQSTTSAQPEPAAQQDTTAADEKPAEQAGQTDAGQKDAQKSAQQTEAPAEEKSEEKAAPKKAARKSAKKSTRNSSRKRTSAPTTDEAPAEDVKAESAATAETPAEAPAQEPTADKAAAEKATEEKSTADDASGEKKNEPKKASTRRRRRVTAQGSPKTQGAPKAEAGNDVPSEAPATAAAGSAESAEDTKAEAQAESEVIDAEVSEPRPPKVRARRRTRRTVRRTSTAADGTTSTVRGTQELFSESNEDGSSSESEAAEIVETSTEAPAETPLFVSPKSVGDSQDNHNTRNRQGDQGNRDDSDVIDVEPTDVSVTVDDNESTATATATDSDAGDDDQNRPNRSRRRRRRGRGRGRSGENRQDNNNGDNEGTPNDRDAQADSADSAADSSDNGQQTSPKQEEKSAPKPQEPKPQEPTNRRNTDGAEEKGEGEENVVKQTDEPTAIKGSTRLEAQRRRRADRREQSKKRHVISEAEFLARRESVERTMVVRDRQRHDHNGTVTQVGVLEDDLLVEHMVTSETEESQIGNIYLGRVQNVLPSMEAAFIDIGHDRNGVLYSADVNWRALGPQGKSRRIERYLKSGDQVLVQVSKDPIGHKGPRLTTQISFAGRFLVYVPDGQSAGISRKLPEPERKRLKRILKEVTPEGAGTIVRTAAEGVEQDAIAGDIARLEKQWQDISARADDAKARKGAKPLALYEEPDLLVKVVRDIFNEDFSALVVQGGDSWRTVKNYVDEVAPDLADRVQRYLPKEHGGTDVFDEYRIEEQIEKALDRKVWLPSGGSLIIDRTEAMTVIDVNTGKFTGSGGNLEETVTRNNLEAAEEIVRQMRLRDLGGMIVVDFIDMVLPENQDLVLRRLKEALGRDRTRHEVSEVTSLGLVQMTRKRLGTGLLETFSTECKTCRGTGYLIHEDPVEHEHELPRNKRSPRPHDKANKPRKADKQSLPDDSRSHDPKPRHRNDSEDEGDQGAREQSRRDRDGQRDGTEQDRQDQQGDGRQKPSSRSSQRRRRRRANQQNRQDTPGSQGSVGGGQQREQQSPPVEVSAQQTSGSGEVWSDEDDFFITESSAQREADERADAEALGVVDSIFVTASDDADSADDLDPIAAVAAAAAAAAAELDPDEPSDDRYVAEVTRRRRSGGEDRGGRDERSGREGRGESGDRDDRGGQGRSRGRGRGRGRRRVVRQEQQNPVAQADQSKQTERVEQTVDPIAESVVETVAVVEAEQHKADSSANSDTSTTYAEAVREFEASPRRRRPTRGKSRSDHAPDPADFEQKSTDSGQSRSQRSSQSKQSESRKDETSQKDSRRKKSQPKDTQPKQDEATQSEPKQSQQKGAEEKGDRQQGGSPNRRRRRVVRRVNTQQPEQVQPEGSADDAGSPATGDNAATGNARSGAGQGGGKTAGKKPSGSNRQGGRSGRSRRRVVRKTN